MKIVTVFDLYNILRFYVVIYYDEEFSLYQYLEKLPIEGYSFDTIGSMAKYYAFIEIGSIGTNVKMQSYLARPGQKISLSIDIEKIFKLDIMTLLTYMLNGH